MLGVLPEKLTSAIRWVVLVALIFFSANAYPAQGRFSCAPAKEMMIGIIKAGFAYVANMAEKRGIGVQLYIDQYSNFKIIGVDSNLNSCVILEGTDFKSVVHLDL